MSLYSKVSAPWEFTLAGGWHSSGTERWLEVRVMDKASGRFILEFTLDPDEFVKFISNQSMWSDVITGQLARPDIRELWGMVPVQDEVIVPEEVTSKLYGDVAKQAALEWFEERPGSAKFDFFWASHSPEYGWRIITRRYLPPDQAAVEQDRVDNPDDVDEQADDLDLEGDDDDDDD